MSEDWIISQLLYNSKTRKRFLDFEEVEHIKNGKTLTDLPLDVIALVLSYCPLNNVKNCMLISKKCHEAITTRKHFWNRHIQQKLKFSIDPKYIGLYDTFIIKMTLREQHEWLFRKDWFKIDNDTKYYVIRRKDFNNECYEVIIDIKNCKLYAIQYYTSYEFNWKYGICKFYSLDIELTSPVKYMKLKKGICIEGELIFDGSSWKGEVNDNNLPHGKGVWKYKDLTIATEAVNGKPVFNMTVEEYYLFQQDNLRVRMI
jgi:hypothetical protein